jgi:hypothetical protein
LKDRPKGVSSGQTVWQALHDIPVCRAKLGTEWAVVQDKSKRDTAA